MRTLFQNNLVIGGLVLGLAAGLAHGESAGRQHELTYQGRLQIPAAARDAGNGQVWTTDLSLTFFGSAGGEDILSRAPLIMRGVEVRGGIFTVPFALDDEEFRAVFGDERQPVFVEVADLIEKTRYQRHSWRPRLHHITGATPQGGAAAGQAGRGDDGTYQAGAACLAHPSPGAKFVVRNTGASCSESCSGTVPTSSCLRGFTYFSDGRLFDFGNECTVAIPPDVPSPALGRICCCRDLTRPLPVLPEADGSIVTH